MSHDGMKGLKDKTRAALLLILENTTDINWMALVTGLGGGKSVYHSRLVCASRKTVAVVLRWISA